LTGKPRSTDPDTLPSLRVPKTALFPVFREGGKIEYIRREVPLPTKDHFKTTLQVIKADYPLFVEKPLVFKIEEGDAPVMAPDRWETGAGLNPIDRSQTGAPRRAPGCSSRFLQRRD
jgi:hypothetical protein